MKKIESLIDTKNGILFHKFGKESFNHFACNQVNSIHIDKEWTVFFGSGLLTENLIKESCNAFADLNRALSASTKVEDTINLTKHEPIYTRSYTYPISASEFINKEIESLPKDGIIRKSSSSYN